MNNENLPATLRRGADMQEDDIKKQHGEFIRWTPWYIEAMREAADEIERQREVFNEDALLRMTAKYLGTTPGRLRKLVQADKGGRVYVFSEEHNEIVSYIVGGGIMSFHPHGVDVTVGRTEVAMEGEVFAKNATTTEERRHQ